MDKLKQWTALTLVGALGILAIGWFVLISPKRGEAAVLRDQTATQVSANQMLETQIEVLKARAKELPAEQATLAAIAAKIPDNPALPDLVRSLLEASSQAGVELVSITPGNPVPVAPVTAAPAAAAANGQPVAPAPAVAVPAGSAQLANIPVAINVVGGYFEVAQFVAALEELSRAMRVTTIGVTPGLAPTAKSGASADDGSSLTTVINGFVFMSADGSPAPVVASPPVDVTN